MWAFGLEPRSRVRKNGPTSVKPELIQRARPDIFGEAAKIPITLAIEFERAEAVQDYFDSAAPRSPNAKVCAASPHELGANREASFEFGQDGFRLGCKLGATPARAGETPASFKGPRHCTRAARCHLTRP